eukprot:g41756.t1
MGNDVVGGFWSLSFCVQACSMSQVAGHGHSLAQWFFLVPYGLVLCFLLALLTIVASRPRMFFQRLGRTHRIIGLVYLAVLLTYLADLGALAARKQPAAHSPNVAADEARRVLLDVVMGVCGLALTLTAAREFGHKNVVNPASGVLEQERLVSYGEMIEHSFYQGLNLLQIAFLHLLSSPPPALLRVLSLLAPSGYGQACLRGDVAQCALYPLLARLLLCMLATAPWWWRDRFPVHSFSANYSSSKPHSSQVPFMIRLLYRLKKYQYVLYKHFLLHGLNVSVALWKPAQLSHSLRFRMYWFALNCSYTMEFFLQTLVQKKHMAQSTLLALHKLLMAAATVTALDLIWSHVHIGLASLSLLLNFVHRKKELANMCLLCLAALAASALRPDQSAPTALAAAAAHADTL